MSGANDVTVAEFFDAVCKAWGTNDGAQLADQFVADGSLINPFGERADGRSAVAAMYADYFTGMLAGTLTTLQVESIRSMNDRYVLADVAQQIVAPDGSVVLSAHLTALLQRDGDWRFVDSRPYTFADLPA